MPHKKSSDKMRRVIELLPVMNDAMIAREVGLTRERVRQIRVETGVLSDVKSMQCDVFWTEDKVAELMRLDHKKLSRRDAAEQLGCHGDELGKRCRKLELPVFRDPSVKYTEEFIKALYDKHGGNFTKMALELGVAAPGIARKCYKYGLKGMGRYRDKNPIR